jgi:hypothetical protein
MVSIFVKNKRKLLELESDGKLRLYNYYKLNINKIAFSSLKVMAMIMTFRMSEVQFYKIKTINYLQKNNGNLFIPRWTDLGKIKDSLFECPALIEKKILRRRDIIEIVSEYN